jgi:ribosomal protein S18 acetylase RimI-like enzyme
MLEITRAVSVDTQAGRRLSELFIDGFGRQLTFFSPDRERLVRAFAHMFVPDAFSVAVLDRTIVGMGACTLAMAHAVEPRWQPLVAHLGLVKGTIAAVVLKREFHKPMPLTGQRLASIAFMATDARYRGQGVASALLTHFLAQPDYDEYILEVADTNTSAVTVYQRLGFEEFTRIKDKHPDASGANYMLYLHHRKTVAPDH